MKHVGTEIVLDTPPEGWPFVGERVWARDPAHHNYREWGLGIYLGPNLDPSTKDCLPHKIGYLWSRDSEFGKRGAPMPACGYFKEICWSPGNRGEQIKVGMFL